MQATETQRRRDAEKQRPFLLRVSVPLWPVLRNAVDLWRLPKHYSRAGGAYRLSVRRIRSGDVEFPSREATSESTVPRRSRCGCLRMNGVGHSVEGRLANSRMSVPPSGRRAATSIDSTPVPTSGRIAHTYVSEAIRVAARNLLRCCRALPPARDPTLVACSVDRRRTRPVSHGR